MNLRDNETLARLKGHFFEIFDINSSYPSLLTKMLHAIRNSFHYEEVTLFTYETELELDQVAVIASTTFSHAIKKQTTTLLYEKIMTEPIHLTPIPPFAEYDVIILLESSNGKRDILAIKGRQHEELEILQQLRNLCMHFINQAGKIHDTIQEKKKYHRLFQVNEKFHSQLDMGEVLAEMIDTLRLMYPSLESYLLLSQDNSHLHDLPIKELEYDHDHSPAMQAYVTGSIHFEQDEEALQSILYAPLKGKQGVYGLLQVIATNTQFFSNEEVEFIQLLANAAGSALENAQLYQQSKRLVSDLQLINETSHRLNSNLCLADSIQYMTEQIILSFGAEQVCFIQVSEDLRTVNVLEGSTEFFQQSTSRPYVDYIIERLEKETDSIFIGDLRMPRGGDVAFHSLMAVPMVQSGVIKGIAVVLHTSPYYFSFDTFKLLQSLIHHSTLAFTNSMLHEELEKMVITDHLTRLYSRNYLDACIKESMQKDRQGTFLMIDIDNFKRVNDKYGHQVGDEILIQVANIIQTNIRDSDIGARWGGEELAVYLPHISLDIGLTVAKRLVEKVRLLSQPAVTISCGVSYWSHESSKIETFQQLFKRADQALYQAKETGKDRVVYQYEKELS